MTNKDTQKIDGLQLLQSIPSAWLEPTLDVARTMAGAGYRAWIVGGAVRDLILGRPIKDIDLVSAAHPDVVEGLFPKTVPVGKAFGIVVVVHGGKELEMATFRRERGYSDSRRPDLIEYAETAADDARRRDFTCNALYLDPLTGEIADPEGGLADLGKRQLKAVGEPAARFKEDGLRLLRAGRFLAALDLVPAPGLVEAMGGERASIAGVSAERVLDEVSKILHGPDPGRAMDLLAKAGVLALCLPGWEIELSPTQHQRLVRALTDGLCSSPLGDVSRVAAGLAILLDPIPEDEASRSTMSDRLAELKTSRDLRREVLEVLGSRDTIQSLREAQEPTDPVELGRIVAFVSSHSCLAGAAVAGGWMGQGKSDVPQTLARLRAWVAQAPARPVDISAKDVIEAGIAPGPLMGAILGRAELAALGGAFTDRPGASQWIRNEANRAGSRPEA